MTTVWPVVVSVRHIMTTMSAQSSSSAGFFSDAVACPLAFAMRAAESVAAELGRCR
jgi:hypothetical protein